MRVENEKETSDLMSSFVVRTSSVGVRSNHEDHGADAGHVIAGVEPSA